VNSSRGASLLRAADAAVYQAKQFRNTWQHYTPEMLCTPTVAPLAFSILRRSIDERRLEVHYTAHSLQLEVTAEGVETQKQLDYLQDIGCDTLQGVLLGRPVSGPEITSWLQSQQLDRAVPRA